VTEEAIPLDVVPAEHGAAPPIQQLRAVEEGHGGLQVVVLESSPELILDSDGAATAAVGAASGVGRGTADGVRGDRRYLRVAGLGRIGRGGGGGLWWRRGERGGRSE
jgi:hypothetical protein